jgi:putative endonuclease
MYIVYLLRNSAGKLYIGQTADLNKRMLEHNEIGNGYTSKHRPWVLLWSRSFTTRKEAMKEERYLKTGVGRDWIKKNI